MRPLRSSPYVQASLCFLGIAITQIACQSLANRAVNFPSPPALVPSAPFELGTSSFVPGGNIAGAFTCNGQNLSPALAWIGPPATTRSFVLIMKDADEAPGRSVHWLVYNIPASATGLSEAIPTREDLAGGARQGTTDFGETGYSGPCSRLGTTRHYAFRLYALDTTLPNKFRATAKYVEREMKGHVLAESAITCAYKGEAATAQQASLDKANSLKREEQPF
jgi:Raf kinase inhibitor-like YbhB/YbcL family protein